MKFRIYKYHGTGNDFILADNREGHIILNQAQISWLCHRRFGVGADGLILLDHCGGFDFGMRYFNSDGRESTMCGNGGRCIVAFADFLSGRTGTFRFHGPDGEHFGTVISKHGDEYLVKLSMQDVKNYRMQGDDFILDTGSPHFVRFVENAHALNVQVEGRNIRQMKQFQPAGINVNFVSQEDGQLFVRTYERGVEDETLSCGTGVTASALAFSIVKDIQEGVVRVKTRGGKIEVFFKTKHDRYTEIFLLGPAIKVFECMIDTGEMFFPEDQVD